ncbi:hypothetical protein ACNAW0_18850 [Micromonospora sp. SL1-18]
MRSPSWRRGSADLANAGSRLAHQFALIADLTLFLASMVVLFSATRSTRR